MPRVRMRRERRISGMQMADVLPNGLQDTQAGLEVGHCRNRTVTYTDSYTPPPPENLDAWDEHGWQPRDPVYAPCARRHVRAARLNLWHNLADDMEAPLTRLLLQAGVCPCQCRPLARKSACQRAFLDTKAAIRH